MALPLSSGPCSDNLLCTTSCQDQDQDLDRVLNRPSPEQLGSLWFSRDFWAIFLCLLVGGICSSSSTYFQDAICQQMVQGTVEDFGGQRLWASVGWGICSVMVGYLIDLDSRDKLLFDYSTPMKIFLLFLLADMVVVGFWKVDC